MSNDLPETKIEDDVVDPRVQIELERLNTATDDINKLEVDLDEARATFRELLCESTYKIDCLAKKLGSCINKSRPYYEARFRAKEALTETQKAAVKFERANSQHAAAKEMVYLAEEGLKTDGRCFDHAWQEMLNHATSRVNESEHERAVCEVEHRRTTIWYHKAEHEVQRLQQELKRAITKSRPYYEMKARFNQMLEEQKIKVGILEKSVADAKMTYAEALRNLERISDEIHRTRGCDGTNNYDKQAKNTSKPSNDSSSSSTTESPDSTDYASDEYLCLPEPKVENDEHCNKSTIIMSSTEPRRYIKRDRIATPDAKNTLNQNIASSSNLPDISRILSPIEKKVKIQFPTNEKESKGVQNGEEWTEINLNNSPENIHCKDEIFSDDEDQIPDDASTHSTNTIKQKKLVSQKSLPVMIENNDISLSKEKKAQVTRSPSFKKKGKLDSCLATWITRNSITGEISAESSANSSRRQSLDVLWNSGTGERVKELLNQGLSILSISNLTERRSSDSKILDDDRERPEKTGPSPLERTMNYLNAEDETSDSESLTSIDMLTEDQISSLMKEPDMNQVCQEILGTPLVEVCPLLQQLQQQQ